MFVKVVVDVCSNFIEPLAFVLHCFIGWRAKEVNKKQIDAQRKQLEAGTNYLGKNKILLVLEEILCSCFVSASQQIIPVYKGKQSSLFSTQFRKL